MSDADGDEMSVGGDLYYDGVVQPGAMTPTEGGEIVDDTVIIYGDGTGKFAVVTRESSTIEVRWVISDERGGSFTPVLELAPGPCS